MDAVHAALAYERSVANDAHHDISIQQHIPFPVDHSMQTPPPNPMNPRGKPPSPADHAMQTPQPTLHRQPPSPSYAEGGCSSGRAEVHEAAVGPTAQTPTPESPTAILASLGGGSVTGGGGGIGVRKVDRHAAGAAAASTLPSFPASPASSSPIRSRADSGVRTPELDVTRPDLFSTTRLRSRVGRRGRGMGLAGEGSDDENDEDDQLEATVVRGERRRGGDLPSPPTPTVLFGALAGDGESTRWGPTTSGAGGGADGDSRDTGLTAVKVMTMRMATTPTKVGGSSNGGGAREDVAASLLSMLRLETSKRKQAEARTAELENAAADAAAVAAAAAASAAVAARDKQQDGNNTDSGDSAAAGDGSGVGSYARRSQGSGAGNGQQASNGQACVPGVPMTTNLGQQQQQQQPGSDWPARFAKADQARQAAKILGLVRDARTKMAKMSSTGGGYFQPYTRYCVAPPYTGGSHAVMPCLSVCSFLVFGLSSRLML